MSGFNDFTLSAAERSNPLWHKLKLYLDHKLERARAQIEDPTLSEPLTQALRGEIKALKGLLALGKELPPITTADDAGPQ